MEGWTLVTGASEGIGRELARVAASEGRNVILAARSLGKLEALAAELKATQGVEAIVLAADLSEPGGAEALWRRAAEGRRIDFLANNAGLGRSGRFGEAEGRARELASIRVNVEALTVLASLAAEHMAASGGGRILNVASLSAFMPGPGFAVYHATKAFALSLSRAIRSELKGAGVSVTALCPGPVRTDFFRAADMEGVRLLKLGRVMDAETVARAGWNAAMRGRAVLVPGLLNKLSALSAKILPAALVTPIAKFVMGRA